MDIKLNSTPISLAVNYTIPSSEEEFTTNTMLINIDSNDTRVPSTLDHIEISITQIFTLILPYIIIFLLAIVGNALVIITLGANRRMRSVTNMFLLNLAVSDLLLGVFCMPFTLVGVLLKQFIFGSVMCSLIPYLQGLYSIYFSYILSIFIPLQPFI